MATEKQRAAARKNVKKAQRGARSSRTLAKLPADTPFCDGTRRSEGRRA